MWPRITRIPLLFVLSAFAVTGAVAGEAKSGYLRSEHSYTVPDAILTDATGKSISLAQELEEDGPMMINFISTRCSEPCAAMSAVFAEVQKQLGPEMRRIRLLSITVDPGYDNVTRLRAYARQVDAGSGWMLLTGRSAEIVPVLKAFDSYSDDKNNPVIATFVRASAKAPWIRIQGAASPVQLVAEYRQALETERHSHDHAVR